MLLNSLWDWVKGSDAGGLIALAAGYLTPSLEKSAICAVFEISWR